MTTPIWVLITQPSGEPAGASLHPSRDAAVDWLRTGWDIDGNFADLSEESLIDALQARGVGVQIEAQYPDWPQPLAGTPDDEVIPGDVWTAFLEQEYQLDLDHPGDVTLSAVIGEIRRLVAEQ